MFTFCTHTPCKSITKQLIFSILNFDDGRNCYVFCDFRRWAANSAAFQSGKSSSNFGGGNIDDADTEPSQTPQTNTSSGSTDQNTSKQQPAKQKSAGERLLFLAHHVNDYRVEGTLYLIDASTGALIDWWSANSGATNDGLGDGGHGYPTPEGDYTATAPYCYQSNGQPFDKQQEYTRDQETFKMNISDAWDPALGRMRTAMEIHPCRYLGTLGCIGLVGTGAQIQAFEIKMQMFFRNNKTIGLTVAYGSASLYPTVQPPRL